MNNLLMISGDRALAGGHHGAFYATLEGLRKFFDRIDVMCPRATGTTGSIRVWDNVTLYPSPFPIVFQPFWIWYRGRSMLSQRHYTVMTVHEYPPFYNGLGAWLLWFGYRIPYLLEIHHIPGHPRAATVREWLYAWLSRIVLRWDAWSATRVRVVNNHETKQFLLAAGIPPSKIEYIPSFYIDHEIFYPRDTVKKYDVVFVGRLEANKGLDLFLDVVQRLKLRALVIGTGSLEGHLQRRGIRDGLAQLEYRGWVKDANAVADCIRSAHALCMTSWNEGGPRVVLEALACGVPVVATRVGIVPDVIHDGLTGYQVNWDGDDIASKLQVLLGDLADTTHSRRIQKECVTVAAQFQKEEALARYAEAVKGISR